MKLNQITLPATDFCKTKTFYALLGCELIVDTPHYLRFKAPTNDTSFSFILSDAPSNCVIYFETEELDKDIATLKHHGISFEQDPQEMRYLWREAILFDPNGNKIKLYFAGENRLNPPWRVQSEKD